MTAPRVGARFVHARQLDPAWRPEPGQRYTDAPHVVMIVTRVNAHSMWYRPVGTTGAGFTTVLTRADTVVGRWLED